MTAAKASCDASLLVFLDPKLKAPNPKPQTRNSKSEINLHQMNMKNQVLGDSMTASNAWLA